MFYSHLYVLDNYRGENGLDPVVEFMKNSHDKYLDAVHDLFDMTNILNEEGLKPYKIAITKNNEVQFEHTF